MFRSMEVRGTRIRILRASAVTSAPGAGSHDISLTQHPGGAPSKYDRSPRSGMTAVEPKGDILLAWPRVRDVFTAAILSRPACWPRAEGQCPPIYLEISDRSDFIDCKETMRFSSSIY
jgi:hypothetical protein